MKRLQDCGTVIGDCNITPSASRLQYFILKSIFNHISRIRNLLQNINTVHKQLKTTFKEKRTHTMPFGPKVVLTRSAIAIAPIKDD